MVRLLVPSAALALASCVEFSPSGIPRPRISPGRFGLEALALSPEGRLVAFQWVDRDEKRGGLGLLDWHSGKLTRIPNPSAGSLAQPSFSPDGRYLAASFNRVQLAIIDLPTLKSWPITDANKFRGAPAFHPTMAKLVYVARPNVGWRHLKLLDFIDGNDEILIEQKLGFLAIFNPTFIGPDEIVFTAYSPQHPELQSALERTGRAPRTSAATYKLRIGNHPELAYEDIHRQQRAISPRFGDTSNIAWSRNGRRVVFIGHSATHPNRTGRFNYEIFKLEDGQITQMTSLLSHLARLAISYDGSVAAFGSDPSRNGRWDLAIVDLSTGSLREVPLLTRLSDTPEFSEA
jgi:Tol biopolymer transport system component